jgi:hypothetical protein
VTALPFDGLIVFLLETNMRKLWSFPLLLLALALMAGCGSDSKSKKVSLAPAQNTVVVMTGGSVYVGFKAENTEIIYPESISAGTFTAVGRYGANFKAASADDTPLAPGTYAFSVKAAADKSKTAEVAILVTAKVVLDPVDGKTPSNSTYTLKALSEGAISNPVWSFSGNNIGTWTTDGLTATVKVLDDKYNKPISLNAYDGGSDDPWVSDTAARPHDPSLDGKGIPATAHVYGATGSPIPGAIDGYTKVGAIAGLQPGQWTVFEYTADFGGGPVAISYLILNPDPASFDADILGKMATATVTVTDNVTGKPVKVSTTVTVEAAGGFPPAELADALPIGAAPWFSAKSGAHEPALDSLGIPDAAYVYGLFDGSYAAQPVPASISGYTSGSLATLAAGQYAVVNTGFFNYVVIVPAVPLAPELAAAFPIGATPWFSEKTGAHEPALNSLGIPDAAYVYGLFDGSYAAVAVPASISGYARSAGAVSALAAGQYAVVNTGYFNYVVIIPGRK